MAIPPITPGDATSALTCPDCGWSGNTSQVVVDGDCWYCPECQQRIAPQAPVLTKTASEMTVAEIVAELKRRNERFPVGDNFLLDLANRLADEPKAPLDEDMRALLMTAYDWFGDGAPENLKKRIRDLVAPLSPIDETDLKWARSQLNRGG